MPAWARTLAAMLLLCTLAPWLPAAASAQPRLLRWGYVVTDDPASVASLRAAAGRLDFVSPSFFTLDGAGQVRGKDDPRIRELARSGGARLVPMVQNRVRYGAFSPVLVHPAVRARAVAGIVGLVGRYGYDGIHVDFEGLRPQDRAGLTRFVAELAAQLRPRGKLVTIAVPSRASDSAGSWSAPYDYAELGRVADYVVVMTYAYRTSQSTTHGSFAPAPEVERAARYAASRIPRSKVLLGIGLWGYDWTVGRAGRTAVRRHPETVALGQRRGGTFGYSAEHQSAWLKYADAAGSHVVWYEDRRSVQAKMAIAERNGLGGIAAWRLGQEDPGIWQVLGPVVPRR